MNKNAAVWPLFLLPGLALFVGCGSSASHSTAPAPAPTPVSAPGPLSESNLNLIFVVSEDLAYNAAGDVNPGTANLTDRGLQRSLLMATFLRQHVLGSKNVTGIYTLAPMTHLQTADNDPDMAAPETVQQFALLNQVTLSSSPAGGTPYTANSYPLNVSYAAAGAPSGVAVQARPCANCQGLDFNDENGDNETLVTGILKANVPGFFVFSAPWETTKSLLTNLNALEGYNLTLPASYSGPNSVYAISIAPSGGASLVTFDSNLAPPSTYPALNSPALASAPCAAQAPFTISITGGAAGAVIPPEINRNETLYIIRHAEAHPQGSWDDGNYVGAGQWRALDLPSALAGKISPDQVYSSDPAQAIQGTASSSSNSYWSYVRPALTVEPYAIANNLPFHLAASFDLFATSPPQLSTQASDFFFTGEQFSNQKILLAWEHDRIATTVNALLSSYFPHGIAPMAPAWPSADYDTIWTVKLDAVGNVTVDNALCEGIESAALPVTAPQF